MLLAQTLYDALLPLFQLAQAHRNPSFPRKPHEVATKWAQGVGVWAAPIFPPSTTQPAAQAAFWHALEQGLLGHHRYAVEEAFMALAVALAPGMAPAFVAVPPPGMPDFTPVYLLAKGGAKGPACLRVLAQEATAWMNLGSATPAAGGVVVPWH